MKTVRLGIHLYPNSQQTGCLRPIQAPLPADLVARTRRPTANRVVYSRRFPDSDVYVTYRTGHTRAKRYPHGPRVPLTCTVHGASPCTIPRATSERTAALTHVSSAGT
eukprot:4638617-Prymnesium_polylepis.2